MDKAKAAVEDFMSKSGHHNTTVHEKVAPAVVNERRHQHEHENVTTAVDKEVHQDHYHTSVQPIKDREVLPEKHQHNIIPVEHREHHHGNDESIRQRLEQEAAQFRSSTVDGEVKHTHSTAPVVAGEHRHHHVHEVIQPVVQKETIQPSVVHTTVPIHEVHHNEAKHHATSALPAMSMADYKAKGGALTGREERYDAFEGEPKSVANELGGSGGTGTSGLTGSSTTGRTGTTTGTTGTTGSRTGTDSTYDDTTTTGKKPSLMSRLNPMKDTDGDGKRGVMD